VVGLLVAGQLLVAAPEAHAQLSRTVDDGVVARPVRHVGRDSTPARRFDLTLDDAVQRALERNLDIAVQRIHPLVQDMQVAAANAAFLPFASSGFNVNQATLPNRFVFDGGGLRGQPIVSDRADTTSGSASRSSGAAAATTSPGTARARSRPTSFRPSTRASART